MIARYQICLSRHFAPEELLWSGLTILIKGVITAILNVITTSYKQEQEYDYTAITAGYAILLKRYNHS